MVDPRRGRESRQLGLERLPRVSGFGLRARRRRPREERVERWGVKARVVERAPALRGLEHGAEVRERKIAGDAGDQQVEALGHLARARQKRRELELTDLEADAALGEIGLEQLLHGVVTASHRQELQGQRLPCFARAPFAAASPPGRIEQRIREPRVLHRRPRQGERILRRHGAGRRRSVAGEGGVHDAIPVDRCVDRAPDTNVARAAAAAR